MVEILLMVAGIGVAGVWGALQIQTVQAVGQVAARLRPDSLFVSAAYGSDFRALTIGAGDTGWRRALIAVSSETMTIYPVKRAMDEYATFPRESLRWFGRPVKYHQGRNEIWLHFQTEAGWQVIKVRLNRSAMAALVRALKEYALPELVIAYRRRRPYVHYGEARVQPAEQDIHGAWTLGDPLLLYVTPVQIVVIEQARVLRTIPLAQVQQVAALRRLDRPNADGLATFNASGEKFAFACKEYQALAQAIADAARRSLEMPLLQKQKGKESDEDDE